MSDLTFFAPLEFEKAVTHGKNGVIDVKISGCISDNSKDLQGDEVPQNVLDFSIWEKNFGRIKWEHGGGVKSHIGFPISKSTKGNKTLMEGRIYAVPGTPQYEVARDAVGEIENIESFNKSHPDTPKHLGFSLEGGLARDKNTKKITRVVVTDVVLTTKPVNTNTYVQMMKSLEVGAEVNPACATGGGANRAQSIEHNFKTQTIRKANKMHFKSKDEYKKYLLGNGLSEEEADKKVAEWEEAEKSFQARESIHKENEEVCEKALKSIEEFSKSLENNEKLEAFEKSYNDSITPIASGDGNVVYDAKNFMKAIGNATLEYRKDDAKNYKDTMNLFGDMFKVMKNMSTFMKSVDAHVTALAQDNELVIQDNETLKGLVKSMQTAVVTDPASLSKLDIAGKTEQPDYNTPKFSAKEIIEGLRKSIENNDSEALEVQTLAEFSNFQWNSMGKTTQEKIENILNKLNK